MHLKNFSLMRYQDGHYELSPAYDLVPVKIIMPEDTEELALTLNGKKSRLQGKDFFSFGNTLKLSETQIQKALARIFQSLQDSLPQCIEESFMPQEMNEALLALIANRMKNLS